MPSKYSQVETKNDQDVHGQYKEVKVGQTKTRTWKEERKKILCKRCDSVR